MRVVFMGTPNFAVQSLCAILEAGHDVIGVWTRADTQKKRGMKLLPPPVKVLAQAKGIPVYQPKNLRGDETLQQLTALAPDVIIVAAYGRLLPRRVLELPRYGCVNVHASLLPKYRGANPIAAAVLNGECESGISIMRMAEGMDEGPVLLMRRLPLLENETFGSLHDRLAELGGQVLTEALALLEACALSETPQDSAGITYAPATRNEDAKLDFTRSAHEVACHIRACDPVPGAYAMLDGMRIKLYGASEAGGRGEPGVILSCGREGVQIACETGAVCVAEVQAQGGKRMPAAAFFNGHTSMLAKRFS
ncbi:MAG: methionyl-tRNA formyltransferase [Clostridiaceae bacterium]|nr:methionyl-tRNA formyltransferase [Clostridiaceae bacterium]